MTRVAAIDLGTNSTRLLVADVVDGEVRDVVRRTTITRLGEGVDAGGRLAPAAVARVLTCLDGYALEVDGLRAGRTLVVATSAVRDAADGAAFLDEVELRLGFETRLLAGEEEAQWTFRGATAGRELDDGTLVVDIGGGSTELVLGGPGGIDFRLSLDVGSVRLTERYGEDVRAAAGAADALLPDLAPRTAIGGAGTITTYAALDLGLAEYDAERVHGHRLTRDGLSAQVERLAALPLEERRAVPALEPERAPVILAGGAILGAVLDRYGLGWIEASEHDLLEAVALEAAATV